MQDRALDKLIDQHPSDDLVKAIEYKSIAPEIKQGGEQHNGSSSACKNCSFNNQTTF